MGWRVKGGKPRCFSAVRLSKNSQALSDPRGRFRADECYRELLRDFSNQGTVLEAPAAVDYKIEHDAGWGKAHCQRGLSGVKPLTRTERISAQARRLQQTRELELTRGSNQKSRSSDANGSAHAYGLSICALWHASTGCRDRQSVVAMSGRYL